MLKSIDPILNADVLQALRAMGHGDDLIIADTNFPADSVARQTVIGRLLRIDNVTAGRAAKAILSVMPLDAFVDHPASRMEIVGKPNEIPPVQAEVQKEIDAAEGRVLADGLDRALRLLRPRARRPIASSRPASGASMAASSSRRASSRPTRSEARGPVMAQPKQRRRHPRHLRRRSRLSRRAHAGHRRDHRRLRLQDGAGRQGLEPGGCGGARRRRGDVHLARSARTTSATIALATWAEGGRSSRASPRPPTSRPARPSSTSTTRPATTPSSSCRAPPAAITRRRRRCRRRRDPRRGGLRDAARAAGRGGAARPRDRAAAPASSPCSTRRRPSRSTTRSTPLCDYVTPNESEAALLTGLPVTDVDDARKAGDCVPGEGRRRGADHARRGRRAAPHEVAVDARPGVQGRAGGRDDRRGRRLQRRLRRGDRTRRNAPAEAVRFGCAVAGISVTRAGTAPSMPTLAEVEELLAAG